MKSSLNRIIFQMKNISNFQFKNVHNRIDITPQDIYYRDTHKHTQYLYYEFLSFLFLRILRCRELSIDFMYISLPIFKNFKVGRKIEWMNEWEWEWDVRKKESKREREKVRESTIECMYVTWEKSFYVINDSTTTITMELVNISR